AIPAQPAQETVINEKIIGSIYFPVQVHVAIVSKLHEDRILVHALVVEAVEQRAAIRAHIEENGQAGDLSWISGGETAGESRRGPSLRVSVSCSGDEARDAGQGASAGRFVGLDDQVIVLQVESACCMIAAELQVSEPADVGAPAIGAQGYRARQA